MQPLSHEDRITLLGWVEKVKGVDKQRKQQRETGMKDKCFILVQQRKKQQHNQHLKS